MQTKSVEKLLVEEFKMNFQYLFRWSVVKKLVAFFCLFSLCVLFTKVVFDNIASVFHQEGEVLAYALVFALLLFPACIQFNLIDTWLFAAEPTEQGKEDPSAESISKPKRTEHTKPQGNRVYF